MKRWMMPFAGATMLALSVSGLEVVRSFPDVSSIVVRLDVAKLDAVPIMKEIRTTRFEPMLAMIQAWTGVDLNSAKRVWIAVEKKEEAVVVLEGQFDQARIREALTKLGKAQFVEREKVPMAVMLPDDKRPGEFNLGALLDNSTVVFGRPELVEKFIAAAVNGGAGLGPEKLARLADFAASPALLEVVILALDPAQTGMNPFLANVTGGRARLDYKQGADVTLEVGMKQAEMAEPFQKMLDGFLSMYKMMDAQQKTRTPPELRQMLDGITITSEGEKVVVRAHIDEQSLNRIVREKAAGALPPAPAVGATPPPPAPAAAPVPQLTP